MAQNPGGWRLRRLGEAVLLWAGLWIALRAGYELVAPLWPPSHAELSRLCATARSP